MGNSVSTDTYLSKSPCSARNITWQFIHNNGVLPSSYAQCPDAQAILDHHCCDDFTCHPNTWFDKEFSRYGLDNWDGLGSPYPGEVPDNNWSCLKLYHGGKLDLNITLVDKREVNVVPTPPVEAMADKLVHPQSLPIRKPPDILEERAENILTLKPEGISQATRARLVPHPPPSIRPKPPILPKSANEAVEVKNLGVAFSSDPTDSMPISTLESFPTLSDNFLGGFLANIGRKVYFGLFGSITVPEDEEDDVEEFFEEIIKELENNSTMSVIKHITLTHFTQIIPSPARSISSQHINPEKLQQKSETAQRQKRTLIQVPRPTEPVTLPEKKVQHAAELTAIHLADGFQKSNSSASIILQTMQPKRHFPDTSPMLLHATALRIMKRRMHGAPSFTSSIT
ncbi:hypothetical protein G7Y89_g6913 [Cudoniella acicularis]|uniref:Uncharacterized protein n=1 Tax=Cudoniella acicularis TaxID=354080 RepID=A0A8H4RLV0_9HELO|nr:hypothetical protein G7Y89_g6913 [Cudoniella acicularis]